MVSAEELNEKFFMCTVTLSFGAGTLIGEKVAVRVGVLFVLIELTVEGASADGI
jgi:hypothetical protein